MKAKGNRDGNGKFIVRTGNVSEESPTPADCPSAAKQGLTRENLVHELQVHQIELEMQNEELRTAHLALQESRDRYADLYDFAPLGYFTLTGHGRIIEANLTAAALLGVDRQKLINGRFQKFVAPEDLAQWDRQRLHLCRDEKRSCDLTLMRRDGTSFQGRLDCILKQAGGGDGVWRAALSDITESKRLEARLAYDAFHDRLTDLPNRALFFDRLASRIERARRRKTPGFAVVFLDLDRFKLINDGLGHAAGDSLLVEVARLLVKCVREGDTLARLGGDEFAVLIEEVDGAATALRVAERLRLTIERSTTLDGRLFYATASCGVALSSERYRTGEEMLRDADTAMYRAKARGRRRTAVFDEEMHTLALASFEVEQDLRSAIERQEFVVCYQPIVDLVSGRIDGMEALVRWRHPNRGLISPDAFLPVAEDTGLVTFIDEWIIRQACRQATVWRQDHHLSPRMNVNLSDRSVMHPGLIRMLSQVLRETGFDPAGLQLEVSEKVLGAALGDPDACGGLDFCEQIKGLGVGLVLDDFGTGYSSLGRLARMPIDQVKIDQSFISGLNHSEKDRVVVRSVVLLARTLGMQVVAEGVETKEQMRELCEMGCNLAQGFLFSEPVEAAKASEMLRDNLWSDGTIRPRRLQPATRKRHGSVRVV